MHSCCKDKTTSSNIFCSFFLNGCLIRTVQYNFVIVSCKRQASLARRVPRAELIVHDQRIRKNNSHKSRSPMGKKPTAAKQVVAGQLQLIHCFGGKTLSNQCTSNRTSLVLDDFYSSCSHFKWEVLINVKIGESLLMTPQSDFSRDNSLGTAGCNEPITINVTILPSIKQASSGVDGSKLLNVFVVPLLQTAREEASLVQGQHALVADESQEDTYA